MLNNYNKRSIYFFYFFKILSIKSSFFMKILNNKKLNNNSILLRFFWKIKKFTFKKSIKTFIKISRNFYKNIQNSSTNTILISKIVKFKRKLSRRKWVLGKKKDRLIRSVRMRPQVDNKLFGGLVRCNIRNRISKFRINKVNSPGSNFFKKNLSVLDNSIYYFSGYKIINRRFKSVKIFLRETENLLQKDTFFIRKNYNSIFRSPSVLCNRHRKLFNNYCTFISACKYLRNLKKVKKNYIKRRLSRKRNFKNFYLRKKYYIKKLLKNRFLRKRLFNKKYFFNLNRRRVSKMVSNFTHKNNLSSIKKKLNKKSKVSWGRYNWKRGKFIWKSKRFKFRFFKKKRYFKFFLKNKKHFIRYNKYNKLSCSLILNLLNKSTYNWGIVV